MEKTKTKKQRGDQGPSSPDRPAYSPQAAAEASHKRDLAQPSPQVTTTRRPFTLTVTVSPLTTLPLWIALRLLRRSQHNRVGRLDVGENAGGCEAPQGRLPLVLEAVPYAAYTGRSAVV